MKLLKKIAFLLMVGLASTAIYSCAEDGEDGINGKDGVDGQNGTNGSNGLAMLISTVAEPAGENCANGGFKIMVGADTNNDGLLAADEITNSVYACNGVTGTNGTGFLIKTTSEVAGDNCQYGGFRLETGSDTNSNGILDTDEITETTYLCNRISTVTSLRNESLVTIFDEFSMIESIPLISSFDRLATSDGGLFQLGGSADGAGMVKDGDELLLLVNLEDHYSVARVAFNYGLDSDGKLEFSPLRADYMLNSGVSDVSRQCSGTMWETAIHGGLEDIYISSSETFNYTSRGIDPYGVPTPNDEQHIEAFGQFAWENNVPLPQIAYPGKTVVIGGDDDSDPDTNFGQVALYYSEESDQDLENGKVYVLRLEGATETSDEDDLTFGTEYNVEFVEIAGGKDLTLSEMGTASKNAFAFQFMRVEDLDYGKGSAAAGRTVYFAITGRGPGRGTFNDWGTGYKLVLDENDPLKGKMTQIISGNTDKGGNMPLLQSPDNICVTENFVYWQEDPNSFDREHQAYIWQTDLNGSNPAAVLEISLKEELNRDGDTFSGEFGAMFDISDKVGVEGTFVLCLQPHYWESSAFEGVDGHFNYNNPNGSREDDQGSQIIVLTGVPK